MNKILVIAAHPDDETLGCGGALLKHKDSGDEIHWLIASEIKDSDGYDKSLIKKRKKEIHLVEKFFGFNSVSNLGIPATKVDQISMEELVKKISVIFNKVKPNIVYLPFRGDVHSDHKYLFDAAYSCTKSFRYPFIKKVFMMETLSETEFSLPMESEYFIPNVFIDVSNYLHKKIEIMKIYESELGNHPFPRSERNIEALAVFRGSSAGCEYAEAFMLLKEIN